MKTIVLKTTVKAFHGEKALGDYRVVLERSTSEFFPNQLVVVIEQNIKGQWHQTYSWYLSTLLKRQSDKLYIDAGQDWYVTGMTAVFKESFEHV